MLLFSFMVYAQQWQPVSGPDGGSVLEVAANENGDLFVAAQGAGIYRSNNGGQEWEKMAAGIEGYYARTVAVAPNQSIFAGFFYEGIFRSDNNGDSWVAVNNGLTSNSVNDIYVTPSGTIFAGTIDKGVFRSMDNGETWVQTSAVFENSYVTVIGSNAAGDIFVGLLGGMFRSSDNGETWSNLSGGPDVPLCFTFAANGDMYVGADFDDGIYMSGDNGSTWQHLPPFTTTANYSVERLLLLSENEFLAATYGGGIFRTTDGGNTWSASSTGMADDKITALYQINDTIIATTFYGQGIYRSSNQGFSWVISNDGLTGGDVGVLYQDANNGAIYTGIYGQGAYRTFDYGVTWNHLDIVGPIAEVTSFAVAPDGFIFCGVQFNDGSGGVFRSTDNGTTWQEVSAGAFGSGVVSLVVNASGDVFGANQSTGIWRSTNNGDSWEAVLNSCSISSLIIDTSDFLYASSESCGQGIYISRDNGDTWIPSHNGMDFPNLSGVGVNQQGEIFAFTNIFTGTGYDNRVYRSVDQGQTYEEIGGNLPPVSINTMAIGGAGEVLLGTSEGVFSLSTGSSTWETINEGLQNPKVNALLYDASGFIWAGTLGGGMYKREAILGTPYYDYKTSFLGQNYPNPAREFTYIPIYLKEPGNVTLEINNVQGQRLISIAFSSMEVGQHALLIDTSALKPGVYFYSIDTIGKRAARKMVVR